MKKYIIDILIIVGLLVVLNTLRQCAEASKLKDEISQLQRNERTLLDDVQKYRTKDSLSCAKVGDLELSLADAKRYLQEDLATIKSMQVNLKEMAQAEKIVTDTQIKVIERLRDTTITEHDTIVQAKYIEVEKPFYDVHAVVMHDTIRLDLHTRDSLLIIESVKYKRFLGFLWKTKRIKSRTFDVISKNPNTQIENVKVVTIDK